MSAVANNRGGAAAGLSTADAAARLAEHGPNELRGRPRVPVWRRVLNQLRDPLIAVLLAAVVLTTVTGDYPDTIIILVVIVANSAVGVTQELKADGAIAALAALAAPAARVRRDGMSVELPAREIVPGDVVELGEGDIVPADADIVQAAALLVDESALTGESVPVDKAPSGDQLWAGTVVLRGRGVAVVTATGAASAMGRIAGLLDGGPALTPLQRRLIGLGRVLAAVAVVLCLLVMAIGLAQGRGVELMVVTAISLVVAAVPESLPAVITLALALGAKRMAQRHAIVRRLPAVETLGSVTIIATDKTGTLTEGRMVVESLWTPRVEARVTGAGYRPEGEIIPSGEPAVGALLRAASRCNDAALRPPVETDPEWGAVGDPTEAALLAAAAKAGIAPTTEERVAEIPFDSDRRRMTTVHRTEAGDLAVTCKGAPELLLAPRFLAESEATVAAAAERAARYAEEGYRVLAVAGRSQPSGTAGDGDAGAVATADAGAAGAAADGWERDLRLLGLVAIADPPRDAAAATVAACQRAGITLVLITGDHQATARSVATRLGVIGAGEPVATGAELERLPELTRVRVFARTTPEQKLRIVQGWRDAGQVVAMTGDGVNDGPALHRSDIGVAMGRRGTEVARQSADLILADDDLATVVAAVEEGRRVYANVRRFLAYGLSGGAAEILVMLVGPAFGLGLPLLPAQILWINLMTHGLPGVALGAEPVEDASMRQPPRPPSESVLGDGLWQRIARLSVVIAAVSLAVAVWGQQAGRPWQSMLFLALGATQLGVALGVRSRPGTWTNPFLMVAVAVAFALQVLAVYAPPLRQLLGTQPLTVAEVAGIAAASALGYLAARVDRALWRPRRRAPRAG